MKITAASDLHGLINWKALKNIKPCDVFIIAGDIFRNMSNNRAQDARLQLKQLIDFNKIVPEIPAKHVIVIAGNHDWIFEYQKQRILDLNFTYLQDSVVEIDGMKFWGSPWQPFFCDWAFNLPRDGDRIKEVWSLIPEDTQILITHGPPLGTLDLTMFDESVGCAALAERIPKLPKLKAHIFGHIHHSHGYKEVDGVHYFNSSVCDESYMPKNKMHHFEVDDEGLVRR